MRPRRWSRLWSWLFKLHAVALRVSGGAIGRRMYGVPVLLLRYRGAKTGQPRETPLFYCEDGRNLAVIASKLGEPSDPAWFRCLMVNPEAEVQVGRERRAVRARQADEVERARIWQRMVSLDPNYDAYQRRTERRIPVVILEPRDATSYC